MDVRMILGLTLVFVVEARKLLLTDPGTCEDVMEFQETVSKIFPLKTHRNGCPKGYHDCKYKELVKLKKFSSKFERCCALPVGPKKIIKDVICCTGWKYDVPKGICAPQCRSGCENGWCEAPNKCQCFPPYALHDNQCLPPVCTPECGSNATCQRDVCVCQPNFIPLNETHCIPQCKTGYQYDLNLLKCIPKCDAQCINGTCTDVNTCTCHPGFKKENESVCVPDCNPSCVNGECTAPNECNCAKDYEPVNSTHCSPTCKQCDNGDCVAPDKCQCHKGYVKKKGICAPVCDRNCNNGVCVDHNICECDAGYEKDPKDTYNCLPVCQPKCINSSCSAPNKCSCYYGYEMTGNVWACKPKCDGCEFGDCVSPNDCKCHDGYFKTNTSKLGVCSPICSDTCINAVCTAPEQCTCIEGYEKVHSNASECTKPCGKCENGKCVNGECTCETDHVFYNGSCIFSAQVDCNTCLGNCSLDSSCWCADGTPCFYPRVEAEITSTGLAGLEMTWLLCGALVILLVIVMGVIFQRLWAKTKR